jgi:glycosyltransferase involved in cell wall biosynthesis
MKVGFYLRNQSVSEVDLSQPEKGNPGVGGTQFNFVTLPYYLQKYNPTDVTSCIYANVSDRLPESVEHRTASKATDAAHRAKEDGCDAFVFRPTESTRSQGLTEALEDLRLKGIAWGHNVPLSLPHMDALASSPAVRRFVVVGRERLDQIRDHALFQKSRCIYNGFDPRPYIPKGTETDSTPTVTYVGSLIPVKGFHLLAEAWPSVAQRVPDAELVVIGSGRLYDRDAELGKWEIASEEYEQRFRPFLSDQAGNPLPSVHFKGTLGTEKILLLQQANVGVVNPTGATENCPGSAIEFQAAKTPVVSIAEWGLLDTVKHEETGLLVSQPDPSLIADAIVRLLLNTNEQKEFGVRGLQFVKDTFDQEVICTQWCELFGRVQHDRPPIPEPIQQNLFYNDKWLREVLRLLKKAVPRFRDVPPFFATSKRGLVRDLLRRLLPR